MLDAGCWMLVAGCWLLAAGCSLVIFAGVLAALALALTLACLMFFAYGGLNRFHY